MSVSQALSGDADGSKFAAKAVLTAQGLDLAARLDERGSDGRSAFESAGLRGPRQRSLLERLRADRSGLLLSDLRGLGIAADVVHRLARRGLVAVIHDAVARDPFTGPWGAWPDDSANAVPPDLTTDQSDVMEPLRGMLRRPGFQVALLHGVTGSGKTEIYLRLSEEVLSQGKRVLVLVPEIALTPAVATAFRARFGQRVAVQHSGLSDGERHDQWQSIRRGEVDVVVGTRSAVMAPLSAIGLIVVDEEHDASYKQDESPAVPRPRRGHRPRQARGRTGGARFGNAVDSSRTQHALEGRYRLFTLDRRVLDRPMASVTIVNMRDEFAKGGPDPILSRPLVSALGVRLERKEQTLLLLNRRGYSTSVFCRQCGGTTRVPELQRVPGRPPAGHSQLPLLRPSAPRAHGVSDLRWRRTWNRWGSAPNASRPRSPHHSRGARVARLDRDSSTPAGRGRVHSRRDSPGARSTCWSARR